MDPEDAAELLIDDILEHWRIEGLSSTHLDRIRHNLYQADGPDIFVQWRALSSPTVERFKGLRLPPEIGDLHQLETLVSRYSKTKR